MSDYSRSSCRNADVTGDVAVETQRSIPALVVELRRTLSEAADTHLAEPMAKYMKDVAPFFGVQSVARRSVTRSVVSEAQGLGEIDLFTFAFACFDEPERELHYVALDTLRHRQKTLSETTLPLLRELVQTKSWWDTVDSLSGIVGAGVFRFPGWVHEIEDWSTDSDIWIRRVSILHQLGRGDDTDLGRLERVILANTDDKEFFIRKAIGWALRDLAWRQPQTVRTFVELHRSVLSPLSVREATKNIGR